MTDSQTYYHGTKADLKVGDLIEAGNAFNYGKRKQANFVYLTATLDAAIWGAELAVGAGQAGSTSWNQQDPSYKVIPFPESIAHHRRGYGLEGFTPPTSSRKCTITSRTSSNVALRQLKNEHLQPVN